MAQLLKMDGIVMDDTKGRTVPKCDRTGATSIPGIYAAGDVAGIEEASSAMIEGRMSGSAIAAYLGYLSSDSSEHRVDTLENSLSSLRQGMFAPENRGKKIETTEEGIAISQNLLKAGFVTDDEITRCCKMAQKYNLPLVLQPKMIGDKMSVSSDFGGEILDKFISKHQDTRLVPQVHKFLNVR
jgi:hypothetical protein